MKKKSQISIFLALGVLFIIIGLSLVFINSGKQPFEESTADFSEHFFFIEECLQDKAEAVINEVATGGGYFTVTPPLLQFPFFTYPYYLSEGKNYMPTPFDITDELEAGLEDFGKYCQAEFENTFENQVTAEFGKIESEASVSDTKITFGVDYPVTIGSGATKQTTASYIVEVPADVSTLYIAINNFLAEDMKDVGSFCITCLSDIAEEFNLDVNVNLFDNTAVISVSEKDTDFPVHWVFANEYE